MLVGAERADRLRLFVIAVVAADLRVVARQRLSAGIRVGAVRQAIVPEPAGGRIGPFLVARQSEPGLGGARQPGRIGLSVAPAHLYDWAVGGRVAVGQRARAIIDAAPVI